MSIAPAQAATAKSFVTLFIVFFPIEKPWLTLTHGQTPAHPCWGQTKPPRILVEVAAIAREADYP
jgi:hypothetical protein